MQAEAGAAATPAEAERFRHAVDLQLGRRRAFVHQPLVLNYPYLPAIQFFDRGLFPWLPQLEAATPIIREELNALLTKGGGGFAPYVRYPRGAPVNQWSELNHSDAWAATFFIEHGVPNPAMREHCPQTAALLETLPLFDLSGRGPVAFFSLLKPGHRHSATHWRNQHPFDCSPAADRSAGLHLPRRQRNAALDRGRGFRV